MLTVRNNESKMYVKPARIGLRPRFTPVLGYSWVICLVENNNNIILMAQRYSLVTN